MTRNDLAETVLLEVERQLAAILARPRPQKWQVWDIDRDLDDREFGPRYSPSWFGNLTEAGRLRFLRTVKRLEEAGLLDITRTEAGRLERVKLSEAGAVAVAEIRNKVNTP